MGGLDHAGGHVNAASDLILIRHAPAATGGRLCGRTDVGLAEWDGEAARARLAPRIGGLRLVASPARRCVETARAFGEPQTDARLWEQDHGDWEGRAWSEIPDLGPLPPADLAAHRAPGGESFADLCARAVPALRAMAGCAAVVHAGTVRAALSMAVGVPAALSFEVGHLSITHLRLLPGGVSIACVSA